jgi:hypothetical protein
MTDGQRVVMGSDRGPCEAWLCVIVNVCFCDHIYLYHSAERYQKASLRNSLVSDVSARIRLHLSRAGRQV